MPQVAQAADKDGKQNGKKDNEFTIWTAIFNILIGTVYHGIQIFLIIIQNILNFINRGKEKKDSITSTGDIHMTY